VQDEQRLKLPPTLSTLILSFPQPHARKPLYFFPLPCAFATANIFLLNRIRFYLP